MADFSVTIPGITVSEMLDKFRVYANNPNATADEMYAVTNAQQERARISVPLTAGRGVWNYPRPFPSGTTPVVSVQAETPEAADYLLRASIIADTTTNTKTEFMVHRFAASQTLAGTLTALLGSVIQMFRPANDVASITVNCFAEARV